MRWMILMLTAVLLYPAGAFAKAAPVEASGPVVESQALLPNGGFEKAAAEDPDKPAGWHSEAAPGAWNIDREAFLQGAGSLRLSGGAPVAVVSDPAPLGADFTGLSAVAMGRGTGGTARVRWLAGDGTVLREDALRPLKSPEAGGWTRHTLI